MRLKNYLKEKYIGSYTKFSEYFEDERLAIYVNPDARDMQQFKLNGMRFIADPNKRNLYVWDEEIEIHTLMLKYLIRNGFIPITEKYLSGSLLMGSCEVRGSKMVITDIFGSKKLDDSWAWLDKYFSNREDARVFIR
ncbi:MAG TPA: hypothetical protein P5293_04965 [Bacteroidales bacterium]|nr:hypothetical protein [Bacteroidales bacterium]